MDEIRRHVPERVNLLCWISHPIRWLLSHFEWHEWALKIDFYGPGGKLSGELRK
jgi:hypothetical protein